MKLVLGGITVDVVQKDIKNVHLSVYPPNGRVRLSAPLRMSAETIRVFAVSKIGWIKKQQAKPASPEPLAGGSPACSCRRLIIVSTWLKKNEVPMHKVNVCQ
jgi:predicted metal-dependent hydrolase